MIFRVVYLSHMMYLIKLRQQYEVEFDWFSFGVTETIYHSSGVLSNLSSSWTSKPPLSVKYRFEPSSMEQSGGTKSLCSTLERLLAWEKKLYQEVKVVICCISLSSLHVYF